MPLIRSASVATRYRLPAILCALVLAGCAAMVQPHVETGLMDEWSYIRSAQVLAETGHVAYNGWASAMIGWQLLWGALVFKIFGFSFLAARLSMLVLAMVTVFLIQRCMVRAGLSEWNATVGTLAIVATPIMLPLSLSFMTDIPGMLVLMVCLYACLRALQASTEHAQMAWISFAAISNGAGGTVRQIAWLGVLVMVPCTLLLLRKKRAVAVVGLISCVVSVCLMLFALRWFHDQMYSVKLALGLPRPNKGLLRALPGNLLRPALDTVLFLLPLPMMFLPGMLRNRRRAVAFLAVCGVVSLMAVGMAHLGHAGRGLLAPFMQLHGNYVSPFGMYWRWPMHCHYPILLHDGVRWALTIATVMSAVAVGVTLYDKPTLSPVRTGTPTWGQVCFLLLPTIAGYVVILLPRMLVGLILDRYALMLLPLVVILLLHVYQRQVARDLPWPALALVVVMGAYSVAVTHDLFATYRASLVALDEVRATGVPRTEIDGGWEYNAWTELEHGGYSHMAGVRLHSGEVLTTGKEGNTCAIDDLFLTPEVMPRYSLSFDPTACSGEAPYKPVVYRRWLGARTATVYVVNNPRLPGAVHHNTGGCGGPGDLCWGRDALESGKR